MNRLMGMTMPHKSNPTSESEIDYRRPVMNDVADDLDDLTPAWLTAALQSTGCDLVVSAVTGVPIGTGQMGRTYRLELAYEGTGGPSSLVAKLAGADEAMRALVAPGYAAELGFYEELAETLEVRTPRCWYAAIADDHTRFTLLLDDIVEGVPGVQAAGCSVTQARAAIRNLVGLHAPRWNDPVLRDLGFLMRASEDMAAMMRAALADATDGFVDRYRDQLGDDDISILREVSGVIYEWVLARPDPFAVIHGDYRLDNLMFGPVDDDVVALDWQGAGAGPPLRDVAFFLGTSLASDDRRAHEQELIAGYHQRLVAGGIEGYGADRCWDDYRLGHLQGPMVTITGCMYASGERSDQSDAMFLAMARRSCAAIRDLRSLELL